MFMYLSKSAEEGDECLEENFRCIFTGRFDLDDIIRCIVLSGQAQGIGFLIGKSTEHRP